MIERDKDCQKLTFGSLVARRNERGKRKLEDWVMRVIFSESFVNWMFIVKYFMEILFI